MSSVALPSFTRDSSSPQLEGTTSAVAIALESTGPRKRTVHGAYRVTPGDRALIGRDPVRHQAWLVLVNRGTLETRAVRPGYGVTVFEGEEPAGKPIEGYFSVDLHECLDLDARASGMFDLTLVLGPFKSPAVEVSVKA